MSAATFNTSTGHLLAHLERVDLLIQAQLHRARAEYQADPAFQGLHISEEEVAALLERPVGLPSWAGGEWRHSSVHQAADRLADAIGQREEATAESGLAPRLKTLVTLFELSPFERDVLLVCLAPELDPRYERIYAFLQDDVTRKCPSINLALDLLCRSFDEKLDRRSLLRATAPLCAHELIHLLDDASAPRSSHLSTPLRIDRRIADFLLGSDEPAVEPAGLMRLVEAPKGLDEILVSTEIRERLERAADCLEHDPHPPVFCLDGPDGGAKRMAAEALCRRAGIALLVADGRRLAGLDRPQAERAVTLIGREARLLNAAVYWTDVDGLLADGKPFAEGALLGVLAAARAPVLLAVERSWQPARLPQDRHFLRIAFPAPDHAHRVALWTRSLPDSQAIAPAEIEELAAAFRLTTAQIEDATAVAHGLAVARDPGAARIAPDDLWSASRETSNSGIADLAQKIDSRYRWDDIVLPDDQLAQLQEICDTARYRSLVYEQWGFDRKLARGKGLNILFSGSSGTGKTMAADIIANALGLDLYKIDLSCVVSKYIGETEKNLAGIFAAASTSNAILFFDEADALFGKRSEVKDAHDRYANIEIGYLLQKMEEYDGTVILATNLKNNLDDAFARRMAFCVNFPLPDADHRLRIWRKCWPAETPRADDLDLGFMAARFPLTGGNIKNIGLAAAFLAVADGKVVRMEHLIRGTKRELQKIGKVCVEADFGPYYPLVGKAA